ncbi:hypothetical protein JCM11641_007830 [Rhodosporidiobolus odoratus]
MSTSRLRQKIANAADSDQYGNLTESFASIGTPLPSLAESGKKGADQNEFKPLWEQEVTDEQGRRRFHGAFTGGFSAGYFNTVGSKEGWTPSTFKSSRSNRASQNAKTVADAARDFMDEEDLAELASSRQLETSSSYASSSAPAARPGPSRPQASSESTYDPLMGLFGGLPPPPGPDPASADSTSAFDSSLASLIAPSSSRVGLKLMRRMGWRDGQGVGPRVTLGKRKRMAKEMGAVLPSSAAAGEDGDGEAEGEGEGEGDGEGEASKHLYAPLDRPLTLVKSLGVGVGSGNGWGLGYEPGQTLDARLRGEGLGGHGFDREGRVGARDEEEEDPYGGGAGLGALGERERRALGAWQEEEDEDDLDRISWGGTRENGRGCESASKRSARNQEFVDGTRVLPGFVLHTEPVAGPSTSQLPPPPPAGWRPDPTRLWKENQPPAGSADMNCKGKGKQLDAKERGSLLGEKQPSPPPAVPKSVFDYLSSKSRERLAHVTSSGSVPPTASSGTSTNSTPLGGPSRMGASGSFAAPTPAPPPQEEENVALFVPQLDRPTALAALRGFQPYSSASTSPDPVKQTRYTLYLQYQSSGTASTTSSPFGPRTPPNGKMQTVEELNRELSEYAQSARVFKPVSGMLGNRFQTSQSAALDVPKVAPGLYQPPPKSSTAAANGGTGSTDLASKYGDASSNPSQPLKPPEPALTPAQAAARAGNFGPLTRTTSFFRPAKLLCKRFGVRDPHEVQGEEKGDAGVGGKWGEATSGAGFDAAAGGGGAKEAVGKSALEEMMQSAGFKRFQVAAEAEAEVDEESVEVAKGVFEAPAAVSAGGAGNAAAKKRPAPTLETVGLGDDEHQGDEIIEEKKAPADIFAAIFADSSDEDDDEEDEEEMEERVLLVAEAATVLSVDPVPVSAPLEAASALPAPAPAEPPAPKLSLDDLTSYRPSFVSSSARVDPAGASASASTSTSIEKDKPKSSSSSKKKDSKSSKLSKSKRKAGALSFDAEEEGGVHADEREKERIREKKKARRSRDGERDQQKERKRSHSPPPTSSSSSRHARYDADRDERARLSKPAAEAEEDEWAEAAPQVHPSILAAQEKAKEQDDGAGRKGRMKASDLY